MTCDTFHLCLRLWHYRAGRLRGMEVYRPVLRDGRFGWVEWLEAPSFRVTCYHRRSGVTVSSQELGARMSGLGGSIIGWAWSAPR